MLPRLVVLLKVRQILLRLRQKLAQPKRRNESYGRLKKGSRFLHWSRGKLGPDQSHKALDFAVSNGQWLISMGVPNFSHILPS